MTYKLEQDKTDRNVGLLSITVPNPSNGLENILSTAVACFCVIADNDFLNDPHNLIYSWILLMLISLYVPVP